MSYNFESQSSYCTFQGKKMHFKSFSSSVAQEGCCCTSWFPLRLLQLCAFSNLCKTYALTRMIQCVWNCVHSIIIAEKHLHLYWYLCQAVNRFCTSKIWSLWQQSSCCLLPPGSQLLFYWIVVKVSKDSSHRCAGMESKHLSICWEVSPLKIQAVHIQLMPSIF